MLVVKGVQRACGPRARPAQAWCSRSTRSWWETADCSMPSVGVSSLTVCGPGQQAAEDLHPARRREREHRIGQPPGQGHIQVPRAGGWPGAAPCSRHRAAAPAPATIGRISST